MRTQTWGEKSHIEVCDQLLGFGIEHAMPGGDVSRQTDTDDLEHGFEDEQDEMREAGMAGVGPGISDELGGAIYAEETAFDGGAKRRGRREDGHAAVDQSGQTRSLLIGSDR
jgi:hypothetical protein